MSANNATPTLPGVKGYIAIRPAMLQFLRWRENLQPGDALILPGKGAISIYLSELIAFARTLYNPANPLEVPDLPDYTARLHFQCAGAFIDESFFDYAALVSVYFNTFLYHLWLDEVDRYRAVAIVYSRDRLDGQDAIADLLRISGMEYFDELDTAIKRNYRLRDLRGMVHNRRRLK